MPVLVGTKDCPIERLVSTIKTSTSFGSFVDKWTDIARELGTSSALVKQFRRDVHLETLTPSDVLHEITEEWVTRCAKEATLEEFIRVLNRHELNSFEDLIRKEFPHASKPFRKFCHLPDGVEDFLSKRNKNKTVHIILSMNTSLSNTKIDENMNDPLAVVLDFEHYLEIISGPRIPQEGLHFVTANSIQDIKQIMTSITDKKGNLIKSRLVLVTPMQNHRSLLEMVGSQPAWEKATQFTVDKMEWEDLTPVHKHHIFKKLKETLNVSLTEEEDEAIKLLRGQVLISLIAGNEIKIFRETVPPIPRYYIGRTLGTRNHLSLRVLEEVSSDIFVFTQIQRHELSGLVKNQSTDNSSDQLRQSKLTVRYIILDHPSHFDKICNITEKNIHWLRFEDRKLLWNKSSRGVGNIQRYLENRDSQGSLNEEHFCQSLTSNHSVVISDSPGMGKSVLLAKMGYRLSSLHPDRTVLFLVLSEFVKQIKQGGTSDLKTTIRNSLGDMACANELGKFVLNSKFTSGKNTAIELLLDGLDEVNPADLSLTYTILQSIKNDFKSVRLWVTSRPHMLEELEAKLSTLGYTIHPFSKQDQLEFLVSFWSELDSETCPDQARLGQYAENCLDILEATLKATDHNIAGIPLQCLLIGEVYEEEAAVYADTKHGTRSRNIIMINSIADLYKCLVMKKIQIYLTIHMRSDFGGTQDLFHMHVRLSLELIMPEQLERVREALGPAHGIEELLKVGILEGNGPTGAPRFIHRTFAEYFIAWFVAGRMDFLDIVMGCQSFQFTWIASFKFTHHAICQFVNSLIADVSLVNISPTSILIESLNAEVTLRQIAHSCITADLLHLFNLFHQRGAFRKPALSQMFNKNILLFAVQLSSLEMVKLVIALYQENHRLDLAIKTQSLAVAVRRGSFSIMEYLINDHRLGGIVKGRNPKTLPLLHDCVALTRNISPRELEQRLLMVRRIVGLNRRLLEEAGWDGNPPLLANNVHVQILTELIKSSKVANVLATDSNNNTIIHFRTEEKLISSQEYQTLLENIPTDVLRKLVTMKGQFGHTPLMSLVNCMDPTPETLSLLKDAEADFNCVDENGVSLLKICTLMGRNGTTLKKLLQYRAQDQKQLQQILTTTDRKGRTLLHLGAQFGNAGAVLALIDELGMDVNAKDDKGFTPLDLVIRDDFYNGSLSQRIETGRLIHDRGGICKEAVNSDGQSQLHVSVLNGGKESVELLLLIGADVNQVDALGNSALHLAVQTWNLQSVPIIQLLLDNGANPDAPNNTAETPLKMALNNEHLNAQALILFKPCSKITWTPVFATLALKIVIRHEDDLEDEEINGLVMDLITHGADCASCNLDGKTLLHMAAKNKASAGLHAVKYLVEKGANVYAKDNDGNTFLHIYLTGRPTPADFHTMVEYIASNSFADLFDIQGEYCTALQLAVGFLEPLPATLALLRSHGGNFNALDKNGNSILIYALYCKRTTPFMSLLISFGVNWRELTLHNSSMLHTAAQLGTLESLKFFLDLGELDINGVDGDGDTPLHRAVCQAGPGDVLEKCRLLIEHGADITLKNKTGSTPSKYAIERRTDDIHEELECLITQIHRVECGIIEMKTVKDVIDKGENDLERDVKNRTILHNFLSQVNPPSPSDFQILCEYLASRDKLNLLNTPGGEFGSTPIQEAVGNIEVLETTLAFLQTGQVDFNAVDWSGDSILAYALRGQRSTEFIRNLMIINGAEHWDRNSYGRNILHIAAYHGTAEVIQLLLDVDGLELELTGKDIVGSTPLHTVGPTPGTDVLEKFKLLVCHGANVNASDHRNLTPLHQAAMRFDKDIALEVTKYLIESGATFNFAKYSRGASFLHHYISCGYKATPSNFHEVVELLREKGLSTLCQKGKAFENTPATLAARQVDVLHQTLTLLNSKVVPTLEQFEFQCSLLDPAERPSYALSVLSSSVLAAFGTNPPWTQ